MAEQQELLNNIKELRQLYRQLRFEDSGFPYTPTTSQTSLSTYHLMTLPVVRKISKFNKDSLLSRIWSLFKKLEGHQKELPNDVQTMIVEIRASKEIFDHKVNITIDPNSKDEEIIPQLVKSAKPSAAEIQSSSSQFTEISTRPSYTIQEIFDGLIQKTQNQESSNIRKKNALVKMLAAVGLSMNDDYSKLNTARIINQIGANILALEDVNNSGKKNRKTLIEALVKHAHLMEPSYPINSIASLPEIKQDMYSEVSPGHLPYSNEQLLNIFDPKHSAFKDNPDLFWVCSIGLFTGARANAAITLQYQDIINESGIDCIYFHTSKANRVKHYKNKATIRKVPIHKQLLDLGFLDYLKRKQAKTNAAPTDYIFDGAVTSKGNYNNKVILREFTPFITKIGVKKEAGDGFDFHSFRDTLSLALEQVHVSDAYVYKIIGWSPKGIRMTNYLPLSLASIQEQLDSMEYDFLKPHFKKWKEIMSTKP